MRMHAAWLVDSVLTPENFDAESMSFLHAALYPDVRAVSAHRISSWLDVMEAIEALSQSTEDEDPQETIQLGPRAASNFLTHQRRRRAALCRYQTARLELLPGFSWAPVDETFDRRMGELRRHLDVAGKPPRLKSEDAGERSLARWLRHARERDQLGLLSGADSAALRAVTAARDIGGTP